MKITLQKLIDIHACYAARERFKRYREHYKEGILDTRSKKNIYRYLVINNFSADGISRNLLEDINWLAFHTLELRDFREKFLQKYYIRGVWDLTGNVKSLAEWLYYHLNKET